MAASDVPNKAMQSETRSQACPGCRGTGRTKDNDGRDKPCAFCKGAGVSVKAGYSTK